MVEKWKSRAKQDSRDRSVTVTPGWPTGGGGHHASLAHHGVPWHTTPLHDTALCWARLLWLQAGRHIRRGSTGSRKHSSCCAPEITMRLLLIRYMSNLSFGSSFHHLMFSVNILLFLFFLPISALVEMWKLQGFVPSAHFHQPWL